MMLNFKSVSNSFSAASYFGRDNDQSLRKTGEPCVSNSSYTSVLGNSMKSEQLRVLVIPIEKIRRVVSHGNP